MKFYHRTTEKAWEAILKEGYLWGSKRQEELVKTVDVLKQKGLPAISDGMNVYRYTYLAPFDWGESYGIVLLEVEYEPKREDASVCVGGTIKNNDKPIKHNYGFDPPPGQRCVQFSVFEPIYLDKVKRIEVAA